MDTQLRLQEGPVFRIRDLNTPWRSVLHLGQKQEVKRGWQWEGLTDSFSFLNRGRVRLMIRPEGGREQILLRIEEGCLFREIPFLHISLQYPALFEAMEACEVYNFPRSWLQDPRFARDHPELMCSLVSSISVKAGSFSSQLAERTDLPPRTLLCRYLLRMMRDREKTAFNPGVSQSDIAMYLGMHRSSVCRLLKELREEGILGHFTPCRMEILDAAALAEQCHFPQRDKGNPPV